MKISYKLTLTLLFALVSSNVLASEIRHQAFTSETLGREYVYNVYLPNNYETSGLDYPVMYLLHGASGTENSWVGPGNIQEKADQLIAEGAVQPLIIVIPADPNFWWADTKAEPARTAFTRDLMPHVETNFRTIEEREGRVIAGYSAGGFGTVNLVLNHPELFAAAAPLSPAVYLPEPPATSSAQRQDIFLTDGEFDIELWSELNWVTFFEAYKQKGIVVPFYINTGDHDRFDIAYHGAVFYQALREHQPDFTEFRVFDGDHNFAAWGGSVGDAMQYLNRYIVAPR